MSYLHGWFTLLLLRCTRFSTIGDQLTDQFEVEETYAFKQKPCTEKQNHLKTEIKMCCNQFNRSLQNTNIQKNSRKIQSSFL